MVSSADGFKAALITGITGQDGSYLADYLLGKGYVVHGLVQPSSFEQTEHIASLLGHPHLHLHDGDLSDGGSIHRIVAAAQPDEVYNLGAQSHVHVSFGAPEYTADVDALGTLRLLEALRSAPKPCRMLQASTSELFGQAVEVPQNEKTPFHPRSPYAVAKLYAYWIVINYREAYGMVASNAILFNHESPRRGEHFVSRKVSQAVARISRGLQSELVLGNLDARRDWGWAPDYVDAMWRMLQSEEARDLVIATGEVHTVRELVSLAFVEVGLPLRWEGEGLAERGVSEVDGRVLVRVAPELFRPAEAEVLQGDPRVAADVLDWEAGVRFEELVARMVAADLALL